MCDVYAVSQNWLKLLKKRNFDPFRRKNRKVTSEDRFEFGHGAHKVVTTVGQLMFFRFLLENGVIDIVKQKMDEIQQAMRVYNTKRRRGQPTGLSHSTADIPMGVLDSHSKRKRPAQRLSKCRTMPLVKMFDTEVHVDL